MREDFSGEYVAVSDYGTYTKKTDLAIEKNSKGVSELYTNVEASGDEVRSTKAIIKRGELGTYKNGELQGQTAYGVAVGETNDKGEFQNYAWFTATRLSFLDNGYEVAYISKNRLYIENATFLNTVQFGGYKADTSDGLAFVWIGG
jgi:hypothetical protein